MIIHFTRASQTDSFHRFSIFLIYLGQITSAHSPAKHQVYISTPTLFCTIECTKKNILLNRLWGKLGSDHFFHFQRSLCNRFPRALNWRLQYRDVIPYCAEQGNKSGLISMETEVPVRYSAFRIGFSIEIMKPKEIKYMILIILEM